mmetsp:Transcript_8056/g.19136  ORF Transcript_8056/g.19136 Transcript_8056/m.19136 type:complete len:280 (-) Transcript_8056:18-857(-)
MEPPMCTACNHAHFPDQRCPICGHKGKGNSFRLPKFKGSPTHLHFKAFDQHSHEAKWSEYQQEAISHWTALSALASIVRRRVFVQELGIQENLEFDEHEPNSRHVVGFMGDAPVAYARWRLDTAPDGSGSNHSVAVLDRLCVLGNYRTQNVARNMLNFVMQDIAQMPFPMPVTIVVTNVPATYDALLQKLLGHGFAIMSQETFLERGAPHVRLFAHLPAPGAASAAGAGAAAAAPPLPPSAHASAGAAVPAAPFAAGAAAASQLPPAAGPGSGGAAPPT